MKKVAYLLKLLRFRPALHRQITGEFPDALMEENPAPFDG